MTQRVQGIPTKAELEVLQALWRLGPSTVRELHKEMGRGQAYTTVLKFLQIMTGKGLVARKEVGRAHVYSALITEKQGAGDFLKDLIERVFSGSSSRLVMQALGTGRITRRELEEIRQLIETMEGKK